MLEFLLYKFDVGQLQSDSLFPSSVSDLAKEIYEGFSCYFSISECVRALAINNNDISLAVQWLVDFGDKERGKKIMTAVSVTLLAQALVAKF